MQNDILMEMDNDKVVLLVLLDLSAVFGTTDYDILLNILSCRCVIDGTALKWFRSHLSDHTKTVTIGSSH